MSEKTLYVISVAAERAGMHAQTLRTYAQAEKESGFNPRAGWAGNA